jgi:uncharacterized protein
MGSSRTKHERTLEAVELLILQGTPFCNIDCSYCYLPHRSDRSKMTIGTIETTCQRLSEDNLVAPAVEVLWHAGEPLVMPVAFYDDAFAIVESRLPGTAAHHKIQTNATLIDAQWIALFKRWRVSVGVSIDGPPEIHDRHRTTRSRLATSARVADGVARLKDAGLPLNVVCVLTRDSIEKPDELFSFFERLGVSGIGFNIDEVEGSHLTSSHEGKDASARFRAFLLRYFHLVSSRNSKQRVRELQLGLRNVFRKEIGRSAETLPIRVLTVAHNGDFGTFSPELLHVKHASLGAMTFGNVWDREAFKKLVCDQRFLQTLESIERGIDACANTCGYFDVCKGGIPSNKLAEHGTFESTETTACRFKAQAVTDAVVDLLLANDLNRPRA